MTKPTPFSTLLAALRAEPGGAAIDLPPDWGQGRTAYGGIQAALCVAAAEQAFPDLPPLRSAQFAFIGPATGTVRLTASLLRRGRSTGFVAVDLLAAAGPATHATLCFAADRPSPLVWRDLPAPAVPPPTETVPLVRPGHAPAFLQHFDLALAGGLPPGSAGAVPLIQLWVRHRDPASPAGAAALIALADVPPPAALAMAGRLTNISTMTWMLDVLALPQAGDWHLVRSAAEQIAHGICTQRLDAWSADGTPLLASRQAVAVFA